MFLPYIHFFRALAILFIVTGHAIDAFAWPDNDDVERILRIFFSNGSTLFIFIAGYLFQHLSVKYETKKYYITKFKNVIVPYLLVSIPAIIVFTTLMQRTNVADDFYENPVWKQVLLFYLTGYHLAPLWFVPMITIFYVFAPVFVRLDRNGVLYYLLPVFVVVSVLVQRGSPDQSFVHFLSVYVLGMACSRFKTQVSDVTSRTFFLIPVLAAFMALGLVEFQLNVDPPNYWNYLQKVLASLFFLGLFCRFNNHLQSTTAHVIADTSFGVFFIHSYVLTAGKLAYEHFFHHLPTGSVVLWLLVSMATLGICVAAVLLVRKLTGRYSRYLIGS
ncbi:MAG: acyltransferase [Planctomycetaceae bacterium]